jgi:hypothetical protein
MGTSSLPLEQLLATMISNSFLAWEAFIVRTMMGCCVVEPGRMN